MAEEKMNNVINCPLLDCEIAEGMCFEINLVVNHDAVESFVPEVKDWEKAGATCPTCPVSFYKN